MRGSATHFLFAKENFYARLQKLYHKLFNDITTAIEHLQKAQWDAEEMYLDMSEEEFPNGEDLEYFDK